MKILNIQLSLFEEVPTTIRGGEGTVQYGARQTDTGQIQSGFSKRKLPLRMRAMCKGFQPGSKKSKMVSNIEYL